MIRAVAILALLATQASAANWTLIRRISQAASCAASMVDAGTTLQSGMYEGSPVFGRGRPQPARIVGIKLGICAGQIAFSEWKLRKQGPQSEASGALLGMEQAAVFSAFAERNARLQK